MAPELVDELRQALAANATRVIDLFREWDEDGDGDGQVSKKEFRKVLAMLGLQVAKADAEELFDQLDPDGSGNINYKEFNSLLRRGGNVDVPEDSRKDSEKGTDLKFKIRDGSALKRGTSIGTLSLDGDSETSVSEQLRAALEKNSTRVIDLFKEWDEDGDGQISKKEFRTSMKALGLDLPRVEIDAVFDEMDPDGSGTLEYKEINKLLKKSIELNPSLQAGAAGEIATASTNKHALRKGVSKQKSMLNVNLDEDGDVKEQLKQHLFKEAVRIIDLFREWDEDGDGTVSKKEFRKAMPMLGLDVPKVEIDALFDEWDPDGSGNLSLKELNSVLKSGSGLVDHSEDARRDEEKGRENKFQLRKGLSKRGSALGNIDLDEDSELPVREQLKEILKKNSTRIIDLFKEWDEDGDGSVSKKEFRKAMSALGLQLPRVEVDAVFDEMDPDGSGDIEYKELNKLLRSGGEIDARLQAGAAGEIATESKTKFGLRKGKLKNVGSKVLAGVRLSADDTRPMREQIRDALLQNAVRVIDLFKEWDTDGDGTVSKKEFRKAMPMLGLDVPRDEIDKLFDSWDPDGSGALEYKELNTLLKRRA